MRGRADDVALKLVPFGHRIDWCIYLHAPHFEASCNNISYNMLRSENRRHTLCCVSQEKAEAPKFTRVWLP
jgi:hypothetical protein